MKHSAVQSLLAGIESRAKSCPFAPNVVAETAEAIQHWLRAQGLDCVCDVMPGQPFRLDLLSGLLRACSDPDAKLAEILKGGGRYRRPCAHPAFRRLAYCAAQGLARGLACRMQC